MSASKHVDSITLAGHSSDKLNAQCSASNATVFFGALVCSLAVVIWLAWGSRPGNNLTLTDYYIAAVAMAVAGIVVFYRLEQSGETAPILWIWISALLLRLPGVAGAPLFEDDYFRYLFDGWRMVNDGDPYRLAPSAFFGTSGLPAAIEDILSQINYPDIATVYGPVCQWIFALAYLVSPGSIWPLQLFALCADMTVLTLLIGFCRSSLQQNALLLYAWSPLLIKEFAFTAHPDIFAVALSLASIKLMAAGRPLIAGTILGLAVGAKVFAVLLLPFLIYRGSSMRWKLAVGIGFILAVGLTTLSFGSFQIWLPEGLEAMARSWIFNAPLYILLLPVVSAEYVKSGLILLYCGFIAWLWWRPERNIDSQLPSARGDWIYGALLFCIPVLNPWYVAWLMPFMVLYPARWIWIFSLVVQLAYFTEFNLGPGNHSADPNVDQGPGLLHDAGLHNVPNFLVLLQAAAVLTALAIDRVLPLSAAKKPSPQA